MSPDRAELLRLWGFTDVRQSFSATEVAALVDAVDTAAAEVRAYHHDDGTGYVWMAPVTAMDPVFVDLFDDDRISGLAEAILGPSCVYLGYAPAGVWDHPTGWHAAVPAAGRRDLRITVCLDAFETGPGGMVVIPGSQHPGYHEIVRGAFDGGLLDGMDPNILGAAPASATQAGDVHLFDAAVFHCGSGTAHPSRQISFAFHAWPDLDGSSAGWQAPEVREFIARSALWQEGCRLYEDAFVASATGRRLRMIQPALDLGFMAADRPPVTRERVIAAAYPKIE